jgi:L-lactate utilization protein LutB
MEEKDTSQESAWLAEKRARAAIKNLHKKHINAYYAPTKNEALTTVLDMIPGDARVVRGDSITLEQVGVIEALEQRGADLVDPFARDAGGQFLYSSEQAEEMYRQAFTADVFIAGANAVTLDGQIVNTDGKGNRVAPMIFGPKKVILVAGVNKLVADAEAGRRRIREICAPLDVERYIHKYGQTEYEVLPCAKTGLCADCRNDLRFCCYTVVIEAAAITEHGRINVVLVGEALGY